MGGTSTPAGEVVKAIYAAFNRRDLPAMLALAHPHIELHPLRMSPKGPWHGHDGIRALYAEMEREQLRHRFEIEETRTMPDGRIAAIGEVIASGLRTDFVGIHEVADDRIVHTRHYFSDPETLEHLGLSTRRAGQDEPAARGKP